MSDFRPSYDELFFQPESPDKRYAVLHAQCCPAAAKPRNLAPLDGGAPP
jgi:hypothetical protein